MMLTDLAKVLRAGGLKVVERPGWQTRGHGEMDDILGVTCHHTASGRGTGTTLGLSTVENGRPGLDGPLAHLYLNREGTFYVVAAGLCYHAGESLKPEYLNRHRIGIEALAAGDGWSQDWPVVQVNAYARGTAVLADRYRFPVTEILGHKETCKPKGRKIDPTLSMPGLRSMATSELADLRKGPDVLADADVSKIADKVRAELLGPDATVELSEAAARHLDRKEGDEVSLSFLWQWGGPGIGRLAGKVDELENLVEKQGAQLAEVLALLRAKI